MNVFDNYCWINSNLFEHNFWFFKLRILPEGQDLPNVFDNILN